jgi:hypothetical protein
MVSLDDETNRSSRSDDLDSETGMTKGEYLLANLPPYVPVCCLPYGSLQRSPGEGNAHFNEKVRAIKEIQETGALHIDGVSYPMRGSVYSETGFHLIKGGPLLPDLRFYPDQTELTEVVQRVRTLDYTGYGGGAYWAIVDIAVFVDGRLTDVIEVVDTHAPRPDVLELFALAGITVRILTVQQNQDVPTAETVGGG